MQNILQAFSASALVHCKFNLFILLAKHVTRSFRQGCLTRQTKYAFVSLFMQSVFYLRHFAKPLEWPLWKGSAMTAILSVKSSKLAQLDWNVHRVPKKKRRVKLPVFFYDHDSVWIGQRRSNILFSCTSNISSRFCASTGIIWFC